MLERKNIPGKVSPAINEMAISLSTRFSTGDFFTGLTLFFREPIAGAGFIAGCDIKPWYTRVLVKNNENFFYQYRDRSALVYGGIFKDFRLAGDGIKTKLFISGSLSAGYAFGNKLRGTNIVPQNKFKLNPAVVLKFQKEHFILTAGFEFLKSDFYSVGPLWLRTGVAYNIHFRNVRSPVKTIKWY
jgi:hypothetical protein